ncbi:MAG: glutamine synthetase type III, partial [Clostridium sp.]
NQLVMEMMKKVADRHGLTCLLHEKPFEGINGSGKHNNWALSTDTGENLLNPGKTPAENTQFLLFLAAVVEAVDDYADLLRISVATAGNDHRLGANEAPPAVVSMFLGEELEAVVDSIKSETYFEGKGAVQMSIGPKVLPHFTKDNTDRNRTSPFAFTGNKFEFRMPGSSLSLSGPNVILNTAVAESLAGFCKVLEGLTGSELDLAIHKLLKDTFADHARIIFNGNGYTDEWLAEAKKRGLPNLKSTPEALPHLIAEKNIELFTKHHVLTKEELFSRYEILLEDYAKTIHIEAKTMEEMVQKDFLPSLFSYVNDLACTGSTKKELVPGITTKAEEKLITKLSGLADTISDELDTLKEMIGTAEGMDDYLKAGTYYHDTILAEMETIRLAVNDAEVLIPEDYLPYPTYDALLFYI